MARSHRPLPRPGISRLLAVLLDRLDGWIWRNARRLGAPLRRWLAQRAEASRARPDPHATAHCHVEALEPRVLLSADLGIASVALAGGATQSATVQLVRTGSDAIASPVRVTVYASPDAKLDGTDRVLGQVDVPAGGVLDDAIVHIPLDAGRAGAPGSYRLLAEVDSTRAIAESDEANNTAAAPLAFQVGGTIGKTTAGTTIPSLTLTDGDGTQFTVTIAGNGTVDVGTNAAGYTLHVTGSDANTTLTITANGGDGRVSLGEVTVAGAIKAISAAPANLNGPLSVDGPLRTLVLADATDAAIATGGSGPLDVTARTLTGTTLVTTQQIGTLAVHAWTGAGARVQAGSIATLTATGDFRADLVLTGTGAGPLVLGTVNVAGNVGSSLWSVAGRAGNLNLGGSGAGWHANVKGPVSQLLVKGDLSGTFAAASAQLVQVAGRVVDATLLIGANLGTDAVPGGTGTAADTYGAGTLARLRIVGAVTNSLVAVGIDPVNGVYGDGDDVVRGTAANTVQELFVGGTLDDATRIVAPAFPATVTIAGQVLAPSAVPQLSTGTPTGARPVVQAALQSDTGASATDLLTRDPAIAGTAKDAVLLYAMLDPAGGATLPSTNVTASLAADGTFVLTAAQVDALAGGKLADGSHVLRLQAVGAGGIRSALVDVAFVLDRTAPAAGDFAIAAADAIDTAGTQTAAGRVQLQGQADPGATVVLAAQNITVLAGADGRYLLPNVQLAMGDNALTLTITDAAGNTASATRTLTRVTQTGQDAVLAWNDIVLRAIQLDVSDPEYATRTLAIESLAVYDTLAAIEGTPAYMVRRAVTGPVSAPVAVAVAAHRVLSLAYPGQQAIFDAALGNVLSGVPDGAAKDTAIALGLTIADAIWDIRKTDGYLDFVDVPGSSTPGQWRPTGPSYKLPERPQWASLTPFAIAAPDTYRLPPPPALDSAAYAASVEEVRALGGATSTARTADQFQQAQFWADGAGSVTPPGHWNAIAAQVAAAQGNSLTANARLFAQLNVALADAAIACWDTKYAYNLWRPESAIQNADQDNNAATTADPDWRALLITPSHPEYASGHATFSAAAATILGATFGANTAFTTTSSTLPGVTRTFSSFMQAAEEAGRSRIYGGIHFQFTNEASRGMGLQIGQAVLARFALADDTQAPSVVLADTPAAVRTDLTLTGQILDNLSGVATAQYRIDDGPLHALVLDEAGRFTIAAGLALDGSADGRHAVTILARDAAGNLNAGVKREFVLDTQAPALTIPDLQDGAVLAAGARLAGTVDPSGSSIVSLQYRFDDGPLLTLGRDAGGAFGQALALGGLAAGDHTLTVLAVDAAGNTGTVQRNVTLPELVAFGVSKVTPMDGAENVGTTFRPQVFFTRPVNGATLTNDTFYATAADGTKLDTTIVPAQDGTFAWMFFNTPMPGGSTVTLHLKGSAIRAAQDGAFLDADGDGMAGGDLAWSFTTVNTASVAGTRLVGKVVDPGPDLQPMSFDDIRRGPDGVIHTPDDVFLLPLAHVHVYVLGRPDLSTYTDDQGNFAFDGVPVGDVKVAIDGRTATNTPAGIFFPEMVMDVDLKAGRTNTLMGSMGSLTEQEANADRPEVYLPRVQTSALQQVSNTEPTTVKVEPAAAPNLTTEQRASLSLTVAPGTAVGTDGKPMDNVKIGINTVPPELVRDMLPPGVLQHTLDITIQAPGVDTFTKPLEITFPNVFNAAPGTQLNILSFDHTTGRLVITGTATVSADGKTVVSDPGSGVFAPGWHGLTPPGGPSDPPCDPTVPKTVDVPPVAVTAGLEDRFFHNDDGEFTLSFGNAANKIDPSKDPCDPVNMKATPLTVKIELDGPAASFLEGLVATQFDLEPGQQKNIKVTVKDLLANIKAFDKDVLYGTTVKITGWKAGTPGTLLIDQKMYLYRFVDSLDADLADASGAYHKDGVVMLADTLNDGDGNVQRRRPFTVDTGSEKPTLEVADTTNFDAIGSGTDFVFDPTQTSAAKAALTTTVAIKTPKGTTAGTLKLSGEATPITTIDLNLAGLKAAIAAMVADGATAGGDVSPIFFTKAEAALFSTQALIDAFADDVITGIKTKFENAGVLAGGFTFGTAADAIKFNWKTSTDGAYATSKPSAADDGVDLKAADVFNAIQNGSFANFNAGQQDFIASDLINQSSRTNVDIYIDNIFEYEGLGENAASPDPMSLSRARALNAIAKTAAHEATHTLGMPHTAQTFLAAPAGRVAEVQLLTRTGGGAGDTFTLTLGGYTTAALPFNANAAAVQAALTGLASIGAGNLTVAAGPNPGELRLTFGGALLGYDPSLITVATTGALTAAVTSVTQGTGNASLFAGVPGGTLDLMHGGFLDYTGTLQLQPDLSANALQVSMHLGWTHAQVEKLINYWGAHLAAGGAAQGVPLAWYDSANGPDSGLATPTFTGPALAITQADGSAIMRGIDFGAVAIDAADPTATRTFRLYNVGSQTLAFESASIDGAAGQFAGAALGGITLAPGAHYDYTVTYKPTGTGKADATLQITSNGSAQPVRIGLAGTATSVAPRLAIDIANNNVGGQDVAGGAKVANGLITLRNDGQQALDISRIALAGSDNAFALSGVPAGIDAAHPLRLAAGETVVLNVAFDPGKFGLMRAMLQVDSNDAANPHATQTLVGTGTGAVNATLHWGDDFIALESRGRTGADALRTVSDPGGAWSFFLPADEALHYVVFDPVSGLVSHSYDTSAAAGETTDLTLSTFGASTAADSDGDGLPDDIELAIGTNARGRDTNGDGIDDFLAIQQGLNPLGDLALPTGTVSAVTLQGEAQAVDVVPSATNPLQLTAYVATGAHGLAVVDVSAAGTPVVLGALDLPGTSVDVAVDRERAVAAVAASDGGLLLVDVADPASPALLQTVSFAAPVNAVEVRDGLAYVAAGNAIAIVDLNTGDVLQTLDFGGNGGSVTSLALDGSTLYAIDGAYQLRSLAIAGSTLAARDVLALPAGGGKLFAGGGVAYVGAGNGGLAGFQAVDIRNPADLKLLSGVDNNAVGGTAVVANGSGLALAAGYSDFVFGSFRALDLMDVSDPSDTGKLLARYTLPAVPRDVMLANGLAFVADGSAGLQVINYRALDSQGQAPTVSIAVDGIDADPGTPGVQVLEGRTVRVLPTLNDDVQVRSVELLVNGTVVSTDGTFPYELIARAPTIAAGGNTLTVQVRATDTGGNASLSNLVTLTVVPDTFPPVVQSVSVEEGARRFFVRSIDLQFDEPLDLARLDPAGATLVRAGADGLFDTADDVRIGVHLDTRGFGQSLSVITDTYLAPGEYRFRLDPSIVADSAGNVLAAGIERHFSIRPASDIRAGTGTAAIPTAPSANPGQQIGIAVPFDPATARLDVQVVDHAGTVTSTTLQAVRWDADAGMAWFNLPYTAITADAVAYGLKDGVRTDFADGTFPLQIVPVVTGVEVQSVAADGSSAVVLLRGTGFVEGHGSSYTFGTGPNAVRIVDAGTTTGPDVQPVYDPALGQYVNGAVLLTVALSDGAFGAIAATTDGGTSAGLATALAAVQATAWSGTPANAALPSANPGQAITLTGTGLTTASDILLKYTDINGNPAMTRLHPVAANAAGTAATLVLPLEANGIATLQMFGSTSQPVVQIVPTVAGFDANGNVTGSGFIEGATTYTFPGATVTDDAADTGPEVSYYYDPVRGVYVYGGQANLPASVLPRHGAGNLTVTTAGGTSAPLVLNSVRPGSDTAPLGALADVAVNRTTGAVWTLDQGNPGRLVRVNPATGAILQTIPLTADLGNQYTASYAGLQIVPAAMSLGGKAVPAGSLLLFEGYPYNGAPAVAAIDPASGALIAKLDLSTNYYATAGVFDATSGHLFLLSHQFDQMIELNAATGAEIGRIALPLNVQNAAGMAIDPADGNFWIGGWSGTSQLVKVDHAGKELRRVDLASQGVTSNEIQGLAFAADGTLRVASQRGVIYTVRLDADAAVQAPTLTGIVANALLGTAAQANVSAANVGQAIELTGTNFGPGTQVLFNVRDNAGKTSVVAVRPQLVNAAGTRLQVIVPDQASTGDVRVSNVGTRNLGYGGAPDAIHRRLTVQFTAGAATAAVRFADGGLENIDNESWGLDNVRVAQGNTVVFEDDFEAGAKAAWSDARTNDDARALFTRFSGRFNNGSQTLNLSGLTAGQTYTLSFDLYALDSWDGAEGNPDEFSVSVDGATVLARTVSNDLNAVQTVNASAGVRLQVVPTLTGIDGRPGMDDVFNLTGSGFMEGASTVTVGGVPLVDTANATYPFDVTGQRNNTMSVVAPRTLDGPVRITTEGGYAELPGAPAMASQPTRFTGITANAAAGQPGNPATPSANAGQTIVLTGQGFTSNTRVVFQGRDDAGRAGTLTRTGTVGDGGRTLTVIVPALATSGAVTVAGSDKSVDLQIVPVLRGAGGTVTPGGTLLLDATGLSDGTLTVQVDGKGVGSFDVRTVFDTDSGNRGTQQLLRIAVPPGVGAGIVTVSTAGGTSTVRIGAVNVVAGADLPAAADQGDTLATALPVALPVNGSVRVTGGGLANGNDVDLHRVVLGAGEQIAVALADHTYSRLRIFDAAGHEVAAEYRYPNDTGALTWTAGAAGTYYVGVSAFNNTAYDPLIAASGSGSYSGPYTLTLQRLAAGSAHLAGISATAASGTPARAGVASANTGQTITLTGKGLTNADRIVFTVLDDGGRLAWTTVTATAVAADGASLTVQVPTSATTGTVRLERDNAGVLLQVVPTLESVAANPGGQYNSGTLVLKGSGFAEGAMGVLFGGQRLDDMGRNHGLDVYGGNGALQVAVPEGAPSGPIAVVTVGGTSETVGPTVTGIAATAASGTPANAGQAAAVPGQLLTVTGTGLTALTDVVFDVIDSNGTRTQRIVRPTFVNEAGTEVRVTVPLAAVTGTVRVTGDVNGAALPLQILPVVTSVEVQSVAGDGSSAVVVLRGYGFVEGNGSTYTFGTGPAATTVVDAGPALGPDVQNVYDPVHGEYLNGAVVLTVPLSNGVFGAITAATQGGTSAPLTASLAGAQGTAWSGTPANAALPSANPGQAITLTGTGLTTASDILLKYTDINGNPAMTRLHPVAANAAGTAATLVLPLEANGIATLQMFGSTSQPVVQIVPTVAGFDANGNVTGSGFVEGATTYTFPGATVTDDAADTGPEVSYYYDPVRGVYVYGGQANLPASVLPRHGAGNLTVTTAGGTSAPLVLNSVRPGSDTAPLGALADVAVNRATGALWTLDQGNPGRLVRVNPATGAILQTIPLTADLGNQYTASYAGLQVVPAAMSLGGKTVPAGSLLLFEGYPYNGAAAVAAIDPASGALIAKLDLGTNYYATAGVFDATSGHLFLLSHQFDQMIELNAATGAEIGRIALPLNVQNAAGMAIDPADGNFWIGGWSGTSQLVKVDHTGKELRRVDLSSQGVTSNEIQGLAFAADGTLRVASQRGVIYTVRLDADAAVPAPTLTGIVASALLGTAAQANVAAANVGQAIELTGTNFGPGTQVLFNVRDNAGKTSVVAVRPQLVNAAGTRLQVIVPDQASTGDVRVSNVGTRNLGYGGAPDAIHRRLTVQFTAGAATAAVRFADGGLEGIDNESWGLDNVRVAQGNTVVFEDDFEAGAKAAWSDARTNDDARALFSRFSGRFNNGSQTLNLSGLTAGQTYTLSFDLYALDSWDGADGNPDQMTVSVDGTTVLARTVSNDLNAVQTVDASAGVRLQVVPTLTAISARPGTDDVFNLTGSGFMEGTSTVTVGGVKLTDGATNTYPFDVTGQRNDTLAVAAPRTLDGPVRITTDGGYAELPGYASPAAPAPVVVTGMTGTVAPGGTATDPAKAAASPGQAIVLTGQGFTNATQVAFQGRDDTGRAGTLTRTGIVSDGGRTLTVIVPALASSGKVAVAGSGTSLDLQVVPVLRGAGGTAAAGNTLLIEGAGLSAAGLAVAIDGIPVTAFDVRTVIDTDNGNYAVQQLLRVTVPAGVGAGVVTVTSAGGTGTLTLGASALTGSAATASSGTPAEGGVASANTEQTITLTGHGLKNGDRVVFSVLDDGGRLWYATVSPTSVAADGNSLTVVVPVNATTGMVRLERDTAGVLLQIVPTLSDVTSNQGGTWQGGALTLAGSGFAEGTTTVFLGTRRIDDASRSAGLDVYGAGRGLQLAVPDGAPTGPITVRTVGGTSTTTALGLTGITATATSGTAAAPAQASAVPGQTIALTGTGLDTGTDVVFETIDANGRRGEIVARPDSVNAAGTTAQVKVPAQAATGVVRIAGDRNGAALPLQIVPVLSAIEVQSVAQDGLSAVVVLRGSGFVEGAGSSYRFGTQVVTDPGDALGPDVQQSYDSTLNQYVNGIVTLTVPLKDGTFGAITVTTAGGTSTTLTTGFTGITAQAASGAPADAALASANVGQEITVTGTGLSTASAFVLRYVTHEGKPAALLLRPTAAQADGKSATLKVPGEANGAFALSMLGATAQPVLQIVPTVTGFAPDGTLRGSGFVEGATTYAFPGATVHDDGADTAPDVGYYYDPLQNAYVWSGQAVFDANALPHFGTGTLAVTTAGGTATAPVPLLRPGTASVALGALADVAIAPSTGALWVVDQGNPGKVARIDPATGAVLQTIALTEAMGNVYTGAYAGLQVVPGAFSLGGKNVPAGSLLLIEGYPYNGANTVAALDPASGAVLARVDVPVTYYATAGLYDAASGHLFLLSQQFGKLVELDPATGAELASRAVPIGVSSAAGIAIDPADGNFWIGSYGGGTQLVKIDRTGTELRRVDLAAQGLSGNVVGGLAFGADGKLRVASPQGVVHVVSLA